MNSAKLKISLVTVPLLFLSTQLAFAGKEGGGGRTVNGQLYDLYLASQSVPTSPEQLSGFDKVVVKILDHVNATVPAFGQELENTIHKASPTRKRWIFVDDDLHCSDQIALKISAEVVACQTTLNVRIKRQSFNALPVDTQGEVIVHEMVRGVAMEKEIVDDDAIYDLVPVILRQSTASELQAELKRCGYGNYSNISGINAAKLQSKKNIQDVYDLICGGNYVGKDGQFTDLIHKLRAENDALWELDVGEQARKIIYQNMVDLDHMVMRAVAANIDARSNGKEHPGYTDICKALKEKLL